MTSNDTIVSIIVPVYGTEAYLPACIDSICNQSYSNIEIILVDDQSPDGCPKICDQYEQKDSRILVIHQENKGVSGARNTGIRHASGKYIMFVDSDDELYHNAVEVLLRDALLHQADIVSAISKHTDQRNGIISSCEDAEYTVFRDDQSILLSLQGNQNTNAVWGKIYKADFIQGIFFEEGKHINEDGFFLFQCFLKKPVLVQHDVTVYQYNTRRGSGSRQVFTDKHLSMLYFCERKKELIASHFPQYLDYVHNMEVRTSLHVLDALCSTTDEKYKIQQRECVNTVRMLYKYHIPYNEHYQMLAWMVVHGLYPLYKWAVRMKYYRKKR